MPDSHESDVRVLMAEMRHMRQDQKETNTELRGVAKSLHEVAKNMTADRGRLDNLEMRANRSEDQESEIRSRLRAVEAFVDHEKPRLARNEKIKIALTCSIIMLVITLAAKSFIADAGESRPPSHYESTQKH